MKRITAVGSYLHIEIGTQTYVNIDKNTIVMLNLGYYGLTRVLLG